MTHSAIEGSSSSDMWVLEIVRVDVATWLDTVTILVFRISQHVETAEGSVQVRLTERSVLLLTPELGTDSTFQPRLTDTLDIRIKAFVLTSEDLLREVAGVGTGPLLPWVDGSSAHVGRQEGLGRWSREDREGEGEDGRDS